MVMSAICTKIVVPYDHSPLSKKALETAIKLASQDENIELDIITVINATLSYNYYSLINEEEEFKTRSARAKEILDEAVKEVKKLPNKSETFILRGIPSEKIVEFVEQNNADLIVMGSRGLSGLKELFLGSVSHNVVQSAPCPVFIVK